MGETLRQPAAPGLEDPDIFTTSGPIENCKLYKIGRNVALRQAAEMIEQDYCGYENQNIGWGTADRIQGRLDEMIQEG